MSIPIINEIWRPVPGLDGIEASSVGRVRRDGQIALPCMANGYEMVNIYQLRKCVAVHRLVLWAFKGEQPEGVVSRHLDGQKLNNFVCNLEYGTDWDNAQDEVLSGRSVTRNEKSWATKRGKQMKQISVYKQNIARDALTANEQGIKFTFFAGQVGIPYSTLMTWIKWYRTNVINKTEETN